MAFFHNFNLLKFNDSYKSYQLEFDSLRKNNKNTIVIRQLKFIDIIQLEDNEDEWESIKKSIINDITKFELIFKKIHFQKKKKVELKILNNILKFLTYAYLLSEDIRYFNEFLWFSSRNSYRMDKYFKANIYCFYKNIDSDYFYNNNFKVPNNILHNKKKGNSSKYYKNQKVCLIGYPHFFKQSYKNLISKGISVNVIYLPFHKNSILNFFLKSIIYKFYLIFTCNYIPYQKINFKIDSKTLGLALKKEKLYVGFQKLNFLIKDNIISSFSKGLINDHWGYLPLIRGKSTIEFSILFNLPIIVTNHLVEKSIDTGDIVAYYNCDLSRIKKLSTYKIRKHVRKTLSHRITSSIMTLLEKEREELIKNKIELGKTYYDMHPSLIKFINERSIKNYKQISLT